MKKLLLVEDDQTLGKTLQRVLKDEGHEVAWEQSLETSRELLLSKKFDLIILDWMLEDGQGIDLLRELREQKNYTPVIMLTARTELIDKVLGLESGASDYMTKPFEPRELIARVRVQLRDRSLKGASEETQGLKELIEVGELKIDLLQRDVYYAEELIVTTKMEFDLLKLLAESPGRAYSREEILNKVWGYDNFPTTRTVDTHVLQLRHKTNDQLIETIRGIGYRLINLAQKKTNAATHSRSELHP